MKIKLAEGCKSVFVTFKYYYDLQKSGQLNIFRILKNCVLFCMKIKLVNKV